MPKKGIARVDRARRGDVHVLTGEALAARQRGGQGATVTPLRRGIGEGDRSGRLVGYGDASVDGPCSRTAREQGGHKCHLPEAVSCTGHIPSPSVEVDVHDRVGGPPAALSLCKAYAIITEGRYSQRDRQEGGTLCQEPGGQEAQDPLWGARRKRGRDDNRPLY